MPRTGVLILLTLGLALAPLGVLGVRSAWTQMDRIDKQRISLLRGSTREQGRNLAARVRADRSFMESLIRREGPRALPGDLCTLVTRTEWPASPFPAATLIDARNGSNLCTLDATSNPEMAAQKPGSARVTEQEDALIYRSAFTPLQNTALVLRYDKAAIQEIVGPSSLPGRATILLVDGENALELQQASRQRSWINLDLQQNQPVPSLGLQLEGAVNRAMFDNASSALGIATPLIMWLIAVALAWLVVRYFLLNPVAHMGRLLRDYQPGTALLVRSGHRVNVAEIDELELLAQGLVDRVNSDKEQLSGALEAQQGLTKEVHHRVKNNLQIIASMVNLHSRDSESDEAQNAYRVIQRRVAALAVVYRHLQASGETEPGVSASTLLADLVQGLIHSLPPSKSPLISMTCAPMLLSQDTALPVAFFVTELCEIAQYRQPGQAVRVSMEMEETPGCARLSVTGPALAGEDLLCNEHASYSRVIQGLARQLRSPLHQDAHSGTIGLTVPYLSAAGARTGARIG